MKFLIGLYQGGDVYTEIYSVDANDIDDAISLYTQSLKKKLGGLNPAYLGAIKVISCNEENFDTYIDKGKEHRTGRTTRLADDYIQDLFDNIGEKFVIKDHRDDFNSNLHLCNIITSRLSSEHPNVYIKKENNKGELSLTLLKSNYLA